MHKIREGIELELVSKELNHFGGIALFFQDWAVTGVSITSCQRNLMRTYQNEANTTSGITKIASKNFLEFF